jgi:pimeloyl-ACP methyl ester carboxylesterase
MTSAHAFARQTARLVKLYLTVGISLLLAGIAPAQAEDDEYAPPGQLVQVGATKLHLYCVGDGSPTVVVDTGLGESALEWLPVQQRVLHQARFCLYDRAGYGWSELGALPRYSSRIVNELYTLLLQAGEKGPFVLVGHSYGGMNMQLFARRYSYLVAGLVLVDSSSAEQIGRLSLPVLDSVDNFHPLTVGGIATREIVAKPIVPMGFDDDGPGVLALIMMSRTHTMRTVANEYINFKASAAQLALNRGHIPNVPLVVLSRGRLEDGGDPTWAHGNENMWRVLQDDLVHLTPRAAHIIATQSGHAIHLEQPDLVADAITMVLDFARAHGSGDAGNTAGRATTMLRFDDALWKEDTLHTAVDICPFGCSDRIFDSEIGYAGHLAGTTTPEWQRVIYKNKAAGEVATQ